mgnify:FL=1|tara:strand:+ start:209 stop:460 length:252 start_codon:yes stop_codon:yes gene_type:complete
MSDTIFIHNQGTLSEKAETPKVKRGRGRPRKDPNSNDEPQVVLRKEAAAAFRMAKSEYEKDLPYKLSLHQFMLVLIKSLSEDK